MSAANDEFYLRRGAVVLTLVMGLGYLVDYGFNLGLTRVLSAHDYGDFKVAFAFSYFFGLAVLLGGDRAAPMVLAPALERGERRRVGEYLRFYYRGALLLGGGLILMTWGLSLLHVGSSDAADHHPLAWGVVAVPINAAGALLSRTLQSARLPARAAVPWRLGLPLLQLSLFAIVVATRGSLSAFEAIVLSVLATTLIVVWQALEVRRAHVVDWRRDSNARSPRRWLGASVPMMGSFLVALALNQSDLYFLEALGEDAEVGHYAAAATLAHFVPLVQVSMIGLIAPLVKPAIDAGLERSRAVYRRAAWLLFICLVPTVGGLVGFGRQLLDLYGPGYSVGHAALLLLVLGNLGWASAALSSLWLQYRGAAGIVFRVSAATLVVDSALNLVLIPRYGLTGAAAGTATTLLAAATVVLVVHAGRPAPPSAS